MSSEAFVQLALKILSCSQKELAIRLGVSPTQISKWKQGEHMSQEMEDKFRAIVNIGDKDPSFVFWAGSVDEATKWERLIHHLAELAREDAATGYGTYPLEDEAGLLCWDTFRVLIEMGVSIPGEFPKELDIESAETDGNAVSENRYSALIYEIYKSLNDVYGFYAAYVEALIYNDELDLANTPAQNIEPCLLSLAACRTKIDQEVAPRIGEFRRRITKDYEEWLNIVKTRAFRAGVPLKAELLDLVYSSNDELGREAESESLGSNLSRVHPDIYMNELLIRMREIHQVLPVIMKKLGIDEEFQLDR